MLFFYYGPDSWRSKQKVNAIRHKFQEKIDPSGHNIEILDGETLKADDFFQAVSVMGFLADKKLIIVNNLLSNKNIKDWQDQLIKFLNSQKDSPEENYIIFWENDKPDSRTKLYKKLNSLKFSENFELLSPLELKAWLKKQFSLHNKNISSDALDLLISYVGNNLWQMKQEINKLLNYSQKDIDTDSIKEIVSSKIDDNIFNLVDALGHKDKALALKLMEEKLDNEESVQYILAMITRQYRLLIKVKSMGDKASSSMAVMQAIKVPKIVADKILTQSKMYSTAELKKIYSYLLYLDEKFKSTSGQEKILFSKMISDL